MSKATDKALGELHEQLAKVLKEHLGRSGKVTTDSGETIDLAPSPALLNVARQFLRDNHIEVGADSKPGTLHGLAGLPVFEEDNVVPLRKGG